MERNSTKSAQSSKQAAAARKARQRRARYGNDLPKPTPVRFAAGKRREGMEDVDPAEELRLALETDAWRTFALPLLEQLEAARPPTGGDRYTAVELESFMLFHFILGHHIIGDTRTYLMSPRGRAARVLVGFDRPRNTRRPGAGHNRDGVQELLLDGVPSEATISRHVRRLPAEFRDELHRRLFESTRDDHLQDPDMQAECDELWADGSLMATHHTTPIRKPKTREIVNAHKVTCPDGGYVGKRAPVQKQGHGFTHLAIVTKTALTLALDIVANGDSEPVGLLPVAEDLVANVIPQLPRRVRVLTADGAFNSPRLRQTVRRGAVIENIHLCSHDPDEKVKKRAVEMTAERHPLNDRRYKNKWFVNGHRELVCRCGKGHTWRRIDLLKDGSVSLAVEGRCPKCGPVSVTSSDWRRTQNPTAFSRCLPGTPAEKREWSLGNPLTYNNPLAANLGTRRYFGNEGYFSAGTRRYKLLEKGWYRSRPQARARAYAIAFVQHAVAMEQRRRARAALAPPLATAA